MCKHLPHAPSLRSAVVNSDRRAHRKMNTTGASPDVALSHVGERGTQTNKATVSWPPKG